MVTCLLRAAGRLLESPAAKPAVRQWRRMETSEIIEARTPADFSDARRMLLDTHSSMHAAQSVYLSLGFRRIAPYYADPRPDVTCYELVLDGRSQC